MYLDDEKVVRMIHLKTSWYAPEMIKQYRSALVSWYWLAVLHAMQENNWWYSSQDVMRLARMLLCCDEVCDFKTLVLSMLMQTLVLVYNVPCGVYTKYGRNLSPWKWAKGGPHLLSRFEEAYDRIPRISMNHVVWHTPTSARGGDSDSKRRR